MSETIPEIEVLGSWGDAAREKALSDAVRKRRLRYYHTLLFQQYRFLIPPNKRILEVGCGTGELLDDLKPSFGAGVDTNLETIQIARAKFRQLQFHHGSVDTIPPGQKFDFIVLSGLIGELKDVQAFFQSLMACCHSDTRIIIEYNCYLWQCLFKILESVRLKARRPEQNWLTAADIRNLLALVGFECVKIERRICLPFNIPLFSTFLNRLVANLPVLDNLTMTHFMIARPLVYSSREYSTTIVIPCRNEKGNIEEAVTRIPSFGTHQEIIFVEGGSKDGTYEEVERVIKTHPEKDVKLLKQKGTGKGDATREGFAHAKGDILMILDADLTVPPEDLKKFYEALRDNRGEFINGCRLVYPMEDQAMRFLNLCANKLFGIWFSWLLGQRFKDTLCGTKALFRRHYEQIAKNRGFFGRLDPFGDFDLIFGAVKLNLKAIEVPVRYGSRRYGTTQIQRFRHGLLLFRMCFVAMRKFKFR